MRTVETLILDAEGQGDLGRKYGLLRQAGNSLESIYREFVRDDEHLGPLLLARYWVGRANVQTDFEDRRSGEKSAEMALRYDPASAEAHHVLATCMGYNGNLEGSMRHYRMALQLKYERPWESLTGLAYATFLSGKRDEAFRLVEEAIAQRPDYPAASTVRGYLLRESGRDEEALREERRIPKPAP